MKTYVVVVKFTNGQKDILLETSDWNYALIFARENIIYYGYGERIIIETVDRNNNVIDKYVVHHTIKNNLL